VRPIPGNERRGHGVGLPLRGVRVFRQFYWLEVGAVKMALSHPTHQRVTRTVGRLSSENHLAILRSTKLIMVQN
jgi:hypothetical protein